MQAVIFDMDGVIFDSETLVLETWKETARRHGVANVEQVCRMCLGLNAAASKKVFLEYYGADFPYDRYKEEMGRLFHERADGGRLPQKPGIRELLLFLKEQGIRTAVASSTRSDLVRKQLCEGKLLSFFDAVIGGDMVERSKPEPDIFLKAMETLAVSPEQSWVIEDSDNGIRAAAKAGAVPVMVPDLAPPTEEMEQLAKYILPSLTEVREEIERLSGGADRKRPIPGR